MPTRTSGRHSLPPSHRESDFQTPQFDFRIAIQRAPSDWLEKFGSVAPRQRSHSPCYAADARTRPSRNEYADQRFKIASTIASPAKWVKRATARVGEARARCLSLWALSSWQATAKTAVIDALSGVARAAFFRTIACVRDAPPRRPRNEEGHRSSQFAVCPPRRAYQGTVVLRRPRFRQSTRDVEIPAPN